MLPWMRPDNTLDFWTADTAGWLLSVGPLPLPSQGWLYAVEREDGQLPNIMGECSSPEQGQRLAEAALSRLAALPTM